MGVSWLDVKLGVRMLIRYKGITLAGGLALAIAIGLGAGWYDVIAISCIRRCRCRTATGSSKSRCATPRRVLATPSPPRLPQLAHDVRTIEDLGAYRTLSAI